MLTGTGPVDVLLPNVDLAGISYWMSDSVSFMVCVSH